MRTIQSFNLSTYELNKLEGTGILGSSSASTATADSATITPEVFREFGS